MNGLRAFIIQKIRRPLRWRDPCGYVTIFHDYEGEYARQADPVVSHRGVTALLDIEKKYKVKASYNVVGRLFADCPEIISRIIAEGHDIASHSDEHDDYSLQAKHSFQQIDADIKKTKVRFASCGLALEGYRSPQSKWSFCLLRAMWANGLKWSAERDRSAYPYVIYQKEASAILRLPIKKDDWDYIDRGITPEAMYNNLLDTVTDIRRNRSYGAIGFHPWVQGESEQRLEVFAAFLRTISDMEDIRIQSFGDMYRRLIGAQEDCK